MQLLFHGQNLFPISNTKIRKQDVFSSIFLPRNENCNWPNRSAGCLEPLIRVPEVSGSYRENGFPEQGSSHF